MNEETKRELLKAHHYGYSVEEIAKVMKISEEEVNKLIEENTEILEELEVRNYGTAQGN